MTPTPTPKRGKASILSSLGLVTLLTTKSHCVQRSRMFARILAISPVIVT